MTVDFSKDTYDVDVNNQLKTLYNGYVNWDGSWTSSGCSVVNGFSVSGDGQDLCYRQIKLHDANGASKGSFYLVSAQIAIPSAGLAVGNSYTWGYIPKSIIPDKGSFLGETINIISAGRYIVGSGKITISPNHSAGCALNVSPYDYITRPYAATVPNGVFECYIGFIAGTI